MNLFLKTIIFTVSIIFCTFSISSEQKKLFLNTEEAFCRTILKHNCSQQFCKPNEQKVGIINSSNESNDSNLNISQREIEEPNNDHHLSRNRSLETASDFHYKINLKIYRDWLKIKHHIPPADTPFYALGFDNGKLDSFVDHNSWHFNHPVANYRNYNSLTQINPERRVELYIHIELSAIDAVIQSIKNTVASANKTKCILFNLENYKDFLERKQYQNSITNYTNTEIKFLLENENMFNHVRWFENGIELTFFEIVEKFGDLLPEYFYEKM